MNTVRYLLEYGGRLFYSVYEKFFFNDQVLDEKDTGLHEASLLCLLWECGVPSGAILFAKRIFIEHLFKKIKITPDVPKMKVD